MKILLTGVAGFIGWKTAQRLLEEGHIVIGIDNLNTYYDPSIKEWRLKTLLGNPKFRFHKVDIENRGALKLLFEFYRDFDAVMNLAARAGVRYSIKNPYVYFTTNAEGTLNLLELCKDFGVKKFLLASTSSLYAGQPMPFKEELPVNTPISPYAASKKSAEVSCYVYHYLYGLDVSIVRYFTVYGPAGRPDMSIFRFIYKIIKDEPIEIYGDGNQSRDFTYVDDIADGTVKALKPIGYEIINLGGNNPYSLREVLELLEKFLGKRAKVTYRDFHKADLKATWADISKAQKLLGWKPKVSLEEGIRRTVKWFKENWNWVKNIKLP
ncbi:MAG TPA: NAD-dependent epimerase/dehydratase family protein [Aquifex aeolicus]|uniref:NAD-dependent epimerase/dehydratase family protein n=1 Tax=Aquifex aeolicus TaxID=63363 RepID=A0A9D1CFQ7_AQUAO|nr:NAD-dependent epimerase/dehydratase family protein [Aquificales bacterium]HIP86453.1 NAD-dependent epimerase/dehydratase family protein [Aquifex sp.]HIP98681.1 NAD-dependent epimerase/dehydratase family protein [Aquifex aeolicus]HIQ26148.1 NAD-dependent epimerase/dehydratase family protein [Aquifex aeolicus]